MDSKATSSLPMIVFFGVILAFLMAFIFIAIYSQQLDLQVDEQAGALANNLAQAAFTSLSGGQPILSLPWDLGGSQYEIEIQENSVFVVKIIGGRRGGSEYSAVVNTAVAVENGDFSPGGQMYFMRNDDTIVVSAAPIKAPVENILPTPAGEPPEFYDFAKNNPREATAIGAAYFEARELHADETDIDVSAYKWENVNSLLVQIISGGSPFVVLRVTGNDNDMNVGMVERAWIVEHVENGESIDSPMPCPSPDNAYRSGWIYSPQDALDHLRSRTWQRKSNNIAVVVPVNASIEAAAVTTNVSTYPAWRITFESYVIFYEMNPWWEKDETPGFVFQSNPELKPVV